MRYIALMCCFSFLFCSCGSNPESDNVAYNPRSFEYNYSLNPSFSGNPNIKKFNARLSLYSTLPGHTQLSISFSGTSPEQTYKPQIYDVDSTQLNGLGTMAVYNFPNFVAHDSDEVVYSEVLNWDFDSIIQHFPRYLIVPYPLGTNLADSNLLIKGKLGQP